MKRHTLLILVGLLLITACKESPKISDEVRNMELDFRLLRFDRDFANSGTDDLPDLKSRYPMLFPEQYPDSIWVAKMEDTLQISLLNEVDQVFSDFEEEKQELELLFKHIKHYFPRVNMPTVITLTTDVDYNNRVILADTLLLIGLDNYLGMEHRFYQGIDKYIAKKLDKKYLQSDVAAAFANSMVSYPRERDFLAQMIYHGKMLYLKDKWMPLETDAVKINYSEDEYAWAVANEEQVWRYFVERELLYSTDQGLGPRFLDPAPFSKFRLELDSESPGRLGRYLGWMIVRDFMNNNDVGLQQLIGSPAEQIFKNAQYKPKR